MDNNITVVAKNFLAQVNALKSSALEQRKAQYKSTEADPANADLDQKTDELIKNIRFENDKAKLENINKAHAKAAAEIAAEYGQVQSDFAKYAGGNQ